MCKAQLGQLNSDYKEYEALGLEVLIISPDDLAKTKEFFVDAEFEPQFTTLIDANKEILKKYYVLKPDGAVNPSLFLIDQEGKLRFKYIAQHNADRPSKEHIFEIVKIIKN